MSDPLEQILYDVEVYYGEQPLTLNGAPPVRLYGVAKSIEDAISLARSSANSPPATRFFPINIKLTPRPETIPPMRAVSVDVLPMR